MITPKAGYSPSTSMTREQVTDWLMENPDEADKLRQLLCTQQWVAEQAAKWLDMEIFWEQIVNNLPRRTNTLTKESPQQTIDILLDLKRRIEGTISDITLDAISIKHLPS